ncbi:MAG TPA: carboxypeptidase regulatory-like domain-containing protein, partial [Polyangia bacterium]
CTEIALTDSNLTRLPRNSSEGHLPHIAVTTGGASAIECWLRKVGISDSEFTPETGTGRVHLFAGGDKSTGQGSGANQLASGEMFTDAYASLFASPTKLASYDMLLLGCEGAQYPNAKSPYTANVKAYADGGGRILAEHLQFYWFRSGPAPWPSTAAWDGPLSDLSTPVTAFIDTTSVEGMAAGAWMTGIGAATNGQLSVSGAQHSVESVVAPTRQWLDVPAASFPTAMTSATLMLSFATPVEATSGPQCGRADFIDIHSTGAGNSDPLVPFPQGCKSTPPSAQERMLEYRFFDTPTCAP